MSGPTEAHRLTRRGLVKAGAAVALAVGAGSTGEALGGIGHLASPGIGKPRDGAAFLQRATYEPLVGTSFRVLRPDGRKLRMTLIQVQPFPSRGEAFSLLFRARHPIGVEGHLYRIEHSALGSFELFVSPVGRGVKGIDLEAVINRIAT
jgi:hypothetical protein